MKNSEYITYLANELFKACGLKYQALMYKKYRDAKRKLYKEGPFRKPESTQEELESMKEKEYMTTLLEIMEHAAEIKRLTK